MWYNRCTNGTGWTHLKVYDQKGCPGSEHKPTTKLYEVVKTFPSDAMVEKGHYFCLIVSLPLFLRTGRYKVFALP